MDPEPENEYLTYSIEFRSEEEIAYRCGIKNLPNLLDDIIQGDQPVRRGRPQHLTDLQILQATLLWFRRGESLRSLSQAFKIPETSMRDSIHNFVETKFRAWAKRSVRLLDLEEWGAINNSRDILNEYPNKLFYFVDGTVVECFQPKDPDVSMEYFNHKHRLPGISVWFMTAANGRIVHVSEIDSGSLHDARAWNESGIVDLLTQKYGHQPEIQQKVLCIGADKAYPNIDLPIGWHLHITMTGATDMDDGVNQGVRFADPKIAGHRSVVERAIRVFKSWGVSSNVEAMSKLEFFRIDSIFQIIAALSNYMIFKEHNITQI